MSWRIWRRLRSHRSGRSAPATVALLQCPRTWTWLVAGVTAAILRVAAVGVARRPRSPTMVAVALQNPHVLPGSSSRRFCLLEAMTSKIDDVHPKSNRCFISDIFGFPARATCGPHIKSLTIVPRLVGSHVPAHMATADGFDRYAFAGRLEGLSEAAESITCAWVLVKCGAVLCVTLTRVCGTQPRPSMSDFTNAIAKKRHKCGWRRSPSVCRACSLVGCGAALLPLFQCWQRSPGWQSAAIDVPAQ